MKSRPFALYIDDDPTYLKTMSSVLTNLGMNVLVTESPVEFMKSIYHNDLSLFLIDLHLGQYGSGFDLIKQIRQERGNQIPIVVLSGSEDRVDVAHALEVGATDFISKPLDKALLVVKLSRYIKSSQIEDLTAPLFNFTGEKTESLMTLNVQISGIDEMGLKLYGPHHIPKGAEIPVVGEFIRNITGNQDPVQLKVTSTWLEPESDQYGAYGEFNPADLSLMSSVRIWLSKNKSKVS